MYDFISELHIVVTTVMGLVFAILAMCVFVGRKPSLTAVGLLLCFGFDVIRYAFFLIGQVLRLSTGTEVLHYIWQDPYRPQIARTLDVIGLGLCVLFIGIHYVREKRRNNHRSE